MSAHVDGHRATTVREKRQVSDQCPSCNHGSSSCVPVRLYYIGIASDISFRQVACVYDIAVPSGCRSRLNLQRSDIAWSQLAKRLT